MSKKFVAKTTKVKHEGIVPLASKMSKHNIKAAIAPVFNLDELNVVELCNQLKNELNDRSEPWFLFTSARRNQKLSLKRERIEILQRTVESMISVNASLAKARADMLLSQAVTESIINNHFIEQALLDELRQREHVDKLQSVDDTARERLVRLESIEIANLQARAEINALEAKTKGEHAKADLIRNVVDSINLKDLPQILQTYVITSVINPSGNATVGDLELQSELREFVTKEAAAKARLLNAQADQSQSQAAISKATAVDTVRKMRSRKRD